MKKCNMLDSSQSTQNPDIIEIFDDDAPIPNEGRLSNEIS